LIRVRVRGIAATALARILLDKGYTIVQASRIIRDRFGLTDDYSPADVTVKDGDQDELLVIGFMDKASRVYEDLVKELIHVFKWFSPIGLYSIVKGIVLEKDEDKCVVDLGVCKGVLPSCKYGNGDQVLVSVEKAGLKPVEQHYLTTRLRIVGEYVSIIHGSPSITFSEHIRDRDKREHLLAIAASKLVGSGLGIHFRSSSMYGSREEIEREIDELINKLREVLARARSVNAPNIVYEGEFIGLIGLTSVAKSRLDIVRDKVVPTIRNHHSYKSFGENLSELVDFAEKILEVYRDARSYLEGAMRRYVIEKLKSMNRVRIIHAKPDGKTIELTPGFFYDYFEENGVGRIVLSRTMRSDGVYDGLEIQRLSGDVDYMVIYENDWCISHNYYRGGDYIGTYININTPPEILPGLIKYHDLLIDIVVKPDGKIDVVDKDVFEKYCVQNILTEETCRKTKETVNKIIENIDKYIYRR